MSLNAEMEETNAGILLSNFFISGFRVEYIQLVADTKPAVNLGQGYPDFHAPEHIRKALSKIALSENPLTHQYTRGFVSL